MKNVVIRIVGCGLIVGVMVYYLAKQGNKLHKETIARKNKPLSMDEEERAEGVLEYTESADLDIEASRAKAASTIYERHQEATKIIKESMDDIFNTDKKTGIHTDDLNNISDELDKLIEEND